MDTQSNNKEKDAKKYMKQAIKHAVNYIHNTNFPEVNNPDRQEAYKLTKTALKLNPSDKKVVSDAEYVLEDLLGFYNEQLLLEAKKGLEKIS